MTPEQEQFAIELSDKARSHEEWLAVVRYGLKTLLENQLLLMEIICREATRQRDRKNVAGRVLADEMRQIFDELKLKFMVVA